MVLVVLKTSDTGARLSCACKLGFEGNVQMISLPVNQLAVNVSEVDSCIERLGQYLR